MQKENRNVVIKQRCHSKPPHYLVSGAPQSWYAGFHHSDLESSTQVVSQDKQQTWKTLNQVQGDNTNCTSGSTPDLYATQRGFTLIELLVVVLIIGILAAVALPQYQKTVAKARIIRLFPLIRAINNAEQTYKLANGNYVADFSALDIDMPAGGTLVNDGSVSYQNFSCYFQNGGTNPNSLYCQDALVPGLQLEKNFSLKYLYCWTNNSALTNSACSSLAKTQNYSTAGSKRYYIIPFN